MHDQSFLLRLKQLTHAEHQATEESVDLPACLASQADYRRMLERFWGFYGPLEAKLAMRPEWAGAGVAIEQRLKTPALLCDLRALGRSPAAIAGLPRCTDLPAADSFASALGCMYVLEGATLGGQIIAREARRALDLTPERGCAFFSSYGAEVGPMWRAFGALLLQFAVDDAAEAAIVQGARETFQAFRRWLN